MNFETHDSPPGPGKSRPRPTGPAPAAGTPKENRRSARLKAMAGWVLMSLIVLAGCVGSNPSPSEITHYMLEYAPPRTDAHRPLPVVLGVERFQTAPYYSSDRILYRDKDYRRETYHYHRWRASPGDLVTDFLIRDLRSSGRFKAVIGSGHRLGSTHSLEGTVDDFYEDDGADRWRAVLSVNIILVNENEPNRALAVLFQKNYAASEPCRQRNPRAVAEAMSRALARLSRRIIDDVHAALDTRAQ